MPNQPKTPMLSVRCDRELRDAARTKAHAEGTDLTKVVVAFLRQYTERQDVQTLEALIAERNYLRTELDATAIALAETDSKRAELQAALDRQSTDRRRAPSVQGTEKGTGHTADYGPNMKCTICGVRKGQHP